MRAAAARGSKCGRKREERPVDLVTKELSKLEGCCASAVIEQFMQHAPR
jgi:hypothetical protein